MNSVTISAIGQADDVLLVSNDINNLFLLSWLTEQYCSKYRVTLVPSKTKLIAFHTEQQSELCDYARITNRVTICGERVNFSSELEHVGIIRNNASNLPHVTNRITAHKKAMGALLSAGLSRNHRGNPAASLRIMNIYGSGVLFSGTASLVLSKQEILVMDKHYQEMVRNVQKLYEKTPRSVIFLLAGCLPGEAVLHLRQLTLFRMICYLPCDPLYSHADSVLASATLKGKSWFNQILAICMKYSLPHPHQLLKAPPSKYVFKSMIKSAVSTYWKEQFSHEASSLESLKMFHPMNYSLQEPSHIWTCAGSNPFESHKAVVLARMLSGRFRTEKLSRHWSGNNVNGFCRLHTCFDTIGSLEHMLVTCPGLQTIRKLLRIMFLEKTAVLVPLQEQVFQLLNSDPDLQLQLVLDPFVFPAVRELVSIYGPAIRGILAYCSRTYVYYTYREKCRLLGEWPGDFSSSKS